ncbi:MAG: hypothetical protein KatS3mg033_1618 [Thermonema sp.]|uniref:hypothetical protein n=1 Tax=Thermonema sp. TaxID=2231181 RepID=UPI0021DD7DE8|nr:hypothetical protein [Thermonema sp.]GIV39818.1 MAG: hypothetical protein KatS3mg033_1618 [Thermonema sp.]
MLRRALAYGLTLWIAASACFPFQDAEEVSKLPLLWHHYMEHHAGSSFFSFLIEHYVRLNHQHRDEGASEHQKLPMKVHQHEGLQLFFFILTSRELPPLVKLQTVVKGIVGHRAGTPRSAIDFVFHPPRRA